MNKNRVIIVSAAVLLCCGVLFGAAQQEAAVEESGSMFEGVVDIDRSGWEIGKPGGTFVLAQLSDPKSFNPIVAQEISTTDCTDLMFAGPIGRNQLTLEWEPQLAESWKVADDNLSITIKLRKGLKWSDGTPLTAEDVVFTVNEIIKNEGVTTSTRDSIHVGDEMAEWQLIDSVTYKITFPMVTARMFMIASVGPMPKHIWKPVLDEGGAEAINALWGVDADVSEVVCSGPFTVADYVPNQKVVFQKNPNYYQKDEAGNRLPYLDQVIYVISEDQDTMMAKFLAGETDAYSMRGEDYSVLIEKKDQMGFTIYNVGPQAGETFITFNQNPIEGDEDGGIEPPTLKWLSKKEFRVAMAHLIDRETIINNVYYGFGYPQYSPVWSKSPYYWEGAPDAAYPYDPEKAKSILDEIGYVDTDGDGRREDDEGNTISLTLNTNSGNRIREATGTMFTQEAANIGIEINFKPEDFNALVTKLVSTYDWEMILIGLTGGPDPGTGQNVYPSSGSLHMIEPGQESPRREWEKQVNEAWDEANLTVDEAQRKSGFQKVQQLWIENVPWVYTCNQATMHAFKNTWANGKTQPISDYTFKRTLHRVFMK
jgi:peptide/nickel transport system substrate-binding protein